ncbi:MAG: serine hydrolase, partial [Bacteroidota bacterium]
YLGNPPHSSPVHSEISYFLLPGASSVGHKFALTNLAKGKYKDKQIFSEQTYDLLMTPQVKENKIFRYGLGWNVADFRDTQRLEFTGGDVGFDTVIIMVPSAAFAIVVLTNGDFNPPMFEVINTAFDVAKNYE